MAAAISGATDSISAVVTKSFKTRAAATNPSTSSRANDAEQRAANDERCVSEPRKRNGLQVFFVLPFAEGDPNDCPGEESRADRDAKPHQNADPEVDPDDGEHDLYLGGESAQTGNAETPSAKMTKPHAP